MNIGGIDLGRIILYVVIVLLFLFVGFQIGIFPLDWLTNPSR
jgi:hypothetical protein